MDIKEKSSKGLQKEYEILIKKEIISSLVDEKITEFSKQANLPGFRPGKVPMSVLKARFGKQVIGEVINESLNNASKKIVEDNKINAASQPKMEITSFEEGGDLKAKLLVEVVPTFKTPDLTKIKIIRPVVKVTDKEVNEAIERIAKENVKTEILKEKRPVKKDDTVVIDFEGKIDNELFEGGKANGYYLKIGSNTFIPGFETKLIGLNLGETKSIPLKFPDDYQAKELAGKKVVFEVKINEIRKEIPNTINDDFAKSLGLDSLSTLKKNVKDQITSQHENVSRQKAKRDVFDKLADLGDFETPPSLQKEEYLSVCKAMNINSKSDDIKQTAENLDPESGMSEKEKSDANAIASRRVRLGLILSEIGRQNNIKVEEEDKKNAMMREVQKYPGREKEILDYFKNNPEAENQFAGPVFEDKIIDFILELANVVDKEVSVEELYREENFDLKKEAEKSKKTKAKKNNDKINVKTAKKDK